MSEEILIQNLDPDEVVVLDPDNSEELLLGVDSIVILPPSSQPLVTSVNGQTGPVVLGAADVGADPAGAAALLIAQITAASIGAATALQGVKADVALAAIDAPAAVRDTTLTGLSTATATPVVPTDTILEAAGKLQAQVNLKLDSADYNDRFLGLFSSVFGLEAAHPTASAGDYAQVDWGIGVDVIIYAWDVSDAYWAAIGVSTISTTDDVPEGSGNLYFTSQRVRDTPLTGLSTASATLITAADSVLSAAGKLQGQISAVPRKFPVNFWSNQYGSAAATNTVFAASTAFYSFFVAPRPITFTKIGVAFNVNETGRQVKVRYYDFVTRTAVTPVYQFVADVLSPVPELTLPAPVTLPAGVYLVGYHNTGTTASTQQMRSLPSASCLQMPTATQAPLGMTGLTDTSDFASSLPATIPAGAVEYAGGQAIINFFVTG